MCVNSRRDYALLLFVLCYARLYIYSIVLLQVSVTISLCSAQVEKAASDPETQFAVIYSHGLVHWWMPIGQSVAHCPMDITWFPLDTQKCPLIYESWSMPSAQLNITPLEPAVDLSYYQPSGEWQLAGKYVFYL